MTGLTLRHKADPRADGQPLHTEASLLPAVAASLCTMRRQSSACVRTRTVRGGELQLSPLQDPLASERAPKYIYGTPVRSPHESETTALLLAGVRTGDSTRILRRRACLAEPFILEGDT